MHESMEPRFISRPVGAEMGPEATAQDLARELDRAVDQAKQIKSGEEQRLVDLHRRLYEFYKEEQRRQASNRFQMALDEDYFDALQWDEEQILELARRNQAALVYQAIKPMVLWVLGSEKRTRTDYRVLARNEEDMNDPRILTAEKKTKVLKYVDDVNMAQFSTSQAFKESVISGLGWLEDGATNNPGDLPLYAGCESWKNILYDSFGNDLFGKDWRYIFRFRDLDEDIAKAMFPKHAAHIAMMSEEEHKNIGEAEGWYLGEKRDGADWKSPSQTYVGRRQFIDLSGAVHSSRRRLRVIEAWYRVPQQCYVCKGEVFDGERFDPKNPQMKMAYEQSAVMLVNQVQMRMRVAFMTDRAILEDRESPYRHDDFPFTPVWCYRRGRDGAAYGIVRELRDPQDSLNKHMSKVQWLLASNQIVGHRKAAKNWKQIRQQADKPNGTVLFDGDEELSKNVQINRHQGELEPHVRLAELDILHMRENYGLNQDNFGQQSRATSGRAILARQEQGTIMTETIFDNLRMAKQLRGRKRLSLVEQFMVEERVVRVAGDRRGQFNYLAVNKLYQDESGQWRYENDITASQGDFVIDEQDYRASLRQAMAETMAEMLTKMPGEIAFRFLDMWVELLDIPNKEEYVRRVRQLNGMSEDGDPANAEAEAIKQQAEQAIQMAQQQAQEALDKAAQQNEQLAEQNRRLQATIDKQATLLANKTQEIELQREANQQRHDEIMRRLEADAERARMEGDASAAQAAEQKRDAEVKRMADEKKQLEEDLADLQQTIMELQDLMRDTKAQTPIFVDPTGKIGASLEASMKRIQDSLVATVQQAAQATEGAVKQTTAAADKVAAAVENAKPKDSPKKRKKITFVPDAKGDISEAYVEDED